MRFKSGLKLLLLMRAGGILSFFYQLKAIKQPLNPYFSNTLKL